MSLSQDQIARLAKLTALMPNKNIEIDAVLGSVETISATNTDTVNAVSRSGNDSLKPREDVIMEDKNLPDALLNCSPQRIAAHQIVLAGIMQGE